MKKKREIPSKADTHTQTGARYKQIFISYVKKEGKRNNESNEKL